MIFSEKKAVERFVHSILETIEKDMHSFNHVSRVVHNARIETTQFLDDDLSYRNIKCIKDSQHEK